jgi:hypothetical protein
MGGLPRAGTGDEQAEDVEEEEGEEGEEVVVLGSDDDGGRGSEDEDDDGGDGDEFEARRACCERKGQAWSTCGGYCAWAPPNVGCWWCGRPPVATNALSMLSLDARSDLLFFFDFRFLSFSFIFPDYTKFAKCFQFRFETCEIKYSTRR